MKQQKEYKLNKQIYQEIKNKTFANSEEKVKEAIETIKKILNNKKIKQLNNENN
jgi:hypothetical protein